MSKPRYRWWSYAKQTLRAYPLLKAKAEDLKTVSMTQKITDMPMSHSEESRTTERLALSELPKIEQLEYDSVRKTLEQTEKLQSGDLRIKLIDMLYFKKTHTLDGASYELNISYRTARRYNWEFIMLFAVNFGFLEKMD